MPARSYGSGGKYVLFEVDKESKPTGIPMLADPSPGANHYIGIIRLQEFNAFTAATSSFTTKVQIVDKDANTFPIRTIDSEFVWYDSRSTHIGRQINRM